MALARAVDSSHFALAQVFGLGTLNRGLTFIFLRVSFRGVIINFLPRTMAVGFFEVNGARAFRVIMRDIASG